MSEALRAPEQPRLAPDVPAPGSRSDWPLNSTGHTDQAIVSDTAGYAAVPAADPVPQQRDRVTPPWQADDLPSEPPSLRLVEQEPLREPKFDYDLLRDPWSASEPERDSYNATPSLRLVESNWSGTDALDSPISPPPGDSDGDLLIFAQASFSVTVRLNTSFAAVESASTQKYPRRSNW